MPIHVAAQALARLDAEHDDLCAAAGAHITARSTWMRVVLENSDAIPVYVEVRDEGRRVAGVPLALRRGRLVNRVEGPGPGFTDSHWFPATNPEAARRLAGELVELLSSLGRWQLFVDSTPVNDACVAELTQALRWQRSQRGDGMPRLAIGDDRAAENHLSKKIRYQARRGAKAVVEAGHEYALEETTDAATVIAAIPELMHVHRLRDIDLGRVSDIDSPRYARLYEDLVTRHARRGEVRLLTVRASGQLIAYNLMFVDGPALRMWDGRFHPEFEKLNPARVGAVAMVESALADPTVSELDFMRGEEPYKAFLTNEVVNTVDFWAWSGPATRLPRLGYERLREIKRGSPALTRQWQRARQRLTRP